MQAILARIAGKLFAGQKWKLFWKLHRKNVRFNSTVLVVTWSNEIRIFFMSVFRGNIRIVLSLFPTIFRNSILKYFDCTTHSLLADTFSVVIGCIGADLGEVSERADTATSLDGILVTRG